MVKERTDAFKSFIDLVYEIIRHHFFVGEAMFKPELFVAKQVDGRMIFSKP